MIFSLRTAIIAVGLSLSLSVNAVGLDAQQRAIVLIGANVARADISALESALNDALDAGLTVNQVKEVLVHSYAYTGFPRALNGINAFIRVTEARAKQGKQDVEGPASRFFAPSDSREVRRGQGNLTRNALVGIDLSNRTTGYAGFTPAIEDFLIEHLFGDIFYRDAIDVTQRELTTIAMLAALDGTDPQLRAHMNISLRNGLDQADMEDFVALLHDNISQKSAARASSVLAAVTKSDPVLNMALRVQKAGQNRRGPAANFTGEVLVSSPFNGDGRYRGAMVTFAPKARTAWHYHPNGQTLVITAGEGRVQSKGQPVQVVKPGDVVWIPPFVEHWHGGGFDTEMSHAAVLSSDNGQSTVWLQHVSDEEYSRE